MEASIHHLTGTSASCLHGWINHNSLIVCVLLAILLLLLLLLVLLQHNQSSQSNGCLMRLTPLAVWAHQQPVEVIARHAMDETALTHPNKIAQARSC